MKQLTVWPLLMLLIVILFLIYQLRPHWRRLVPALLDEAAHP